MQRQLPDLERTLSPGVQVVALSVSSRSDLKNAIEQIASEPNGALIVFAGPLAVAHRVEITSLAARYRLPAIYPYRLYTKVGGFLSYGNDVFDNYRRAAGYVDRILKGEKPADLPVQFPTRYMLVINLKTAKALGLIVPDTLLARADEVIE